MAIPEAQLETWSAQGSVQQSAATYQVVRNVLNDTQSPYYSKNFEIFLQGSYGNDTNIYADSDVDVVIRLDSVYYSDTSVLTPPEKENYDRNFSKAEYSLIKFKQEVIGWLQTKFGPNVKAGGKAIFIPGNGGRRDADVLGAAEHRIYLTYPNIGAPTYREGIVFWMADGTKIVNYPKQHSANCTAKHQSTSQWFKPTVRIFKNMRNKMIDDGLIEEGLAPSYFIEGLLYNVTDTQFGPTYQTTFVDCINYILTADQTHFHCANGIHWLLRDGHPVCWSPAKFDQFIKALTEFWNNW